MPDASDMHIDSNKESVAALDALPDAAAVPVCESIAFVSTAPDVGAPRITRAHPSSVAPALNEITTFVVEPPATLCR